MDWKILLNQVALLLFQSIAYFGVQKLEGSAHDVEKMLDRRIPFVPETVFIYILWYPLIAVFPLVLYQAVPAMYPAYMIAILTDILLSAVIYLIYPTGFERPEQLPRDLSGRILGWMYAKGNYTGKNCMPSMHCSMCFIIMFFAISCDGMPTGVKALVLMLALAIVLSTVLTKQHVLVDMAAAVPVAAICFMTGEIIC